MNETYYSTLPPSIRTKLEAGAFASLRTHLQDRSDAVQNIDLMTLSGFCRNCLAKWLVVEARKLSADLEMASDPSANNAQLIQALDALGYDETAEHVYGCAYGEWKKRHAKKATDEQMDRYNASKPLHAAHDKELLAVKAEKPTGDEAVALAAASSSQPTGVASPAPDNNAKNPLLSDVCCEDVEGAAGAAASAAVCLPTASAKPATAVPPPSGDLSINIGILTVSDRAAAGQYATGDLSGPAVEQSVESLVANLNSGGGNISYNVLDKDIVPDDMEAIATKLKEWASCDLIFTTGGTGLSPRDVTPEATRSVLDKESHGLMAYVSSECSEGQPLAALSRGTAGMRGNTLIVNLPGSPAGVRQTMNVLFPLLLHAVRDIKTA